VSRPLVVGGDISLTASGLAWPDGVVLTHGRAGLTNQRIHVQERGQALMGLVWELGSLIGCRALGGDLTGLADPLGGVEWPTLVMIEHFASRGAGIDPERAYVWWSLINLLGRHGVPAIVVPPSTLKVYACGMGDANKREVWAGVAEHFPQYEIHKTGKRGTVLASEDHDKADAVTLMAMGRDLLGAPLVELPQKHRRALDALELPPGVRL
jgi:hypothetical protein